MKRSTVTIKQLRAVFAVGLLTAGLAIGVAAPAHAHNYLVSSTPAEGEVLTALPDEFVITTNDDLLELGDDSQGFALQVLDADGLYYGDGCVVVDGPSMTAIAALGAPGAYVMRWQAVSVDGHSIDGEIPFTWEPADISQSSEGSATAPVCGEATEQPSPAPDAEEEPVAPAPESESESDEPAISSDLLWIGGAVLAVVIAAGATMLALSRKKA